MLMHLPHGFILQAGRVYLSFKPTMDGIDWSDSGRVDCVLCGSIHHILQASTFYLSFKPSIDYIDWLDSRRVDCELCRCIHHVMLHYRLVHCIYHSNPKSIILTGQLVGGLHLLMSLKMQMINQ